MYILNERSPKNLLFDFGAVLLDLDLNATLAAMRPLLGENYFFDHERNRFPKIFEQYEVGAVGEVEFFQELQKLSIRDTTTEQLRSAWNAMLGPVPPPRLKMLLRLREQHGVYLLSNTNKTHLDHVLAELRTSYAITDWDTRYFDRTYYSHLIHHRKPDAACYEYVLRDAGIGAQETLLIDDNPANIEAAARLGFQTHLHNDGRDITEVLAHL